MRASSPRAYADSDGWNDGSTRSPSSSNTIRSGDDRSSGYSRGTTSRASSANAPANSTPVGPPPMMQNVVNTARDRSSASIAACSSDSSTWLRSANASPRSFKPSACFAIDALPKKFVVLPAASTRWS